MLPRSEERARSLGSARLQWELLFRAALRTLDGVASRFGAYGQRMLAAPAGDVIDRCRPVRWRQPFADGCRRHADAGPNRCSLAKRLSRDTERVAFGLPRVVGGQSL